ncbi:unnamed protein product [Hydatigera taeniaeformis]|uniref:Peptidase_M16 domain-containing protein n=1 Tax=Hydatigena taeniaeformis TaxID=6205 RepID=A0A0R3X3A9_HYDTA|nr:unnamed protein product [Hydatigera taeniaeformis]
MSSCWVVVCECEKGETVVEGLSGEEDEEEEEEAMGCGGGGGGGGEVEGDGRRVLRHDVGDVIGSGGCGVSGASCEGKWAEWRHMRGWMVGWVMMREEAKEFVDYTLSTLKPREVAVLKPYPKAALPACLNRLRVMNFNKTDVNTSLVLMSPLQGTPSNDLRYEVMNELLESCLQESAYAYLRTRETLGYAVGLYSWSLPSTTGQCGLSVGVSSQANKFDSNLVAGRMYAFWYRIVPYIVLHLNEEAFQTSVEALIASNLLEDATMDVEISRNLKEVFSDRPMFDRRQRAVEILRQLKLSDLQKFYRETYYNFEKQPTLMIQVDSLVDAELMDASLRGDGLNCLKTFNWPLCVIPMSRGQAEAERSAALAVDIHEAVLACASGLVTDAAKVDSTANRFTEKEKSRLVLPRVVEISKVREFKHKGFLNLRTSGFDVGFGSGGSVWYLGRSLINTEASKAVVWSSAWYIELPNGLRAMLVSSLKPEESAVSEANPINPFSEESTQEGSFVRSEGKHMKGLRKSAAALCINVGYFTDPVEVQGLAHLLEHVVLRGSEKYPTENEYDDFVEYYGGNSDACTDGDYTLFFFDISRPFFKEALDRLANAFIAPLLTPDYINAEFENVHHEYCVSRSKDSLRLGQLMASLANEDSPYRRFGFGNRISLKHKPMEAGTDVCALLRDFYLTYYNASLMTLAVESEDTLDHLQAMVTECFGAIPNRNLATDFHAGCAVSDSTHHNQMTSLFGITIDLSELGRTAPCTVADYVFAYLCMLRSAAEFSLAHPTATTTPCGDRTFASLVPEFKKLWELNFRFQEPLEPSINVQMIATAMRTFPPDEVFVAESLILEPDLKAYVEVVNYLTPDKAIIAAFLPEFNVYSITDPKEGVFLKEPWFNIHYAIDEVSDDQIQRWQNPTPLPDFHLPEENRFIATNFELLPKEEDNDVPVNISLGKMQAFGELWHQQRTKFNSPTARVTVRIYSDVPQQARDTAILRLWSCALNQRLQTLLYNASEAGYLYSVSTLDRGLEIAVAGFNEKLLLVYQKIIDLLLQPLVGEEEKHLFSDRNFAVYKVRLRHSTCDRMLDPCNLSTHLKNYFQIPGIHLLEDCMKALEGLTSEDIQAFVPSFLSRVYVKAFVYGNISATEAKEFMDFTMATLNPDVVIDLKPYLKAALPPCLNRLRVMNFNKTDVNTSLLLIHPLQGTPSNDLRYEVMNEVLRHCLHDSAIAYLRNMEKLGSSLGLYSWSLTGTTGQCGLSLHVNSQANRFDCNLVAGRMYAFWYRVMPYIIFHLNEEAFHSSVAELIAVNMLEDKTMDMECSRNFKEVFATRPIFDRRQRTVDILQQLKMSDVQKFYSETYCDLEKQPTLMIQVDSLSDVVSSGVFSKAGSAKLLTTFDWPLCIVPMGVDQADAERHAALAVDVREAVRICAPGLVTEEAQSEPNADFSVEEERAEVALPRFVEILEVRYFKYNVLFP